MGMGDGMLPYVDPMQCEGGGVKTMGVNKTEVHMCNTCN